MAATRPNGRPELARRRRVTGTPHPMLRALLARDYAGHADRTESSPLVLPATASVPLVLKVEDSPRRPPSFVHGVHRSYAVMEGACAPSYLEVWLAPLGAYALLGAPMDELGGTVVSLEEVLGGDARRLAERIRQAPTWHRRFTLLDEFLLSRLEREHRPSPEVAWAWHRIVATAGRIPIRQIATETGWSHRHLIARFRQQVGLVPKTAARLVRFERLLARVEDEPGRWGPLAAAAGYADQAHLVREFREFTGLTPTAFAASALGRSV
jgi:AraC-like DNA-binding protein